MRNPVVCFLEVDKKCVDVFDILPRFVENLLQSENLVCNATAMTKSTLDIVQILFKLFRGIYFQGTLKFEYIQGGIFPGIWSYTE